MLELDDIEHLLGLLENEYKIYTLMLEDGDAIRDYMERKGNEEWKDAEKKEAMLEYAKEQVAVIIRIHTRLKRLHESDYMMLSINL